jgi:hypothetical protein
MTHEITAFFLSHPHLRASNDRAGQACPKQVSSFILRVALDCTETKLLDELAAQVQDNHLRGTNLFRLGPDLVPVFLLPHISKEAEDFIALVQEPAQDAASVEPTRIG